MMHSASRQQDTLQLGFNLIGLVNQAGHIGPSRSLLNYLLMMARTVLDAARLSLERLQALAASMPQQQVRSLV